MKSCTTDTSTHCYIYCYTLYMLQYYMLVVSKECHLGCVHRQIHTGSAPLAAMGHVTW